MTFSLRVEMPLRLQSKLNQRQCWQARSRTAKAEREAGYLLTPRSGWSLPCIITLTRIAPRAWDCDAVPGGFKSVRDGIADRLGVKDNDSRIVWRYRQERGKPKQYAVVVQFEPGEGA